MREGERVIEAMVTVFDEGEPLLFSTDQAAAFRTRRTRRMLRAALEAAGWELDEAGWLCTRDETLAVTELLDAAFPREESP